MMTMSPDENFCAKESMFFLKVSRRSGLRPTRSGIVGDFGLQLLDTVLVSLLVDFLAFRTGDLLESVTVAVESGFGVEDLSSNADSSGELGTVAIGESSSVMLVFVLKDSGVLGLLNSVNQGC